MRVKHFQQFHVACDQGNKVAFVASFQLGARQGAQFTKHKIADVGKQPKRDIVVARLLGIAQKAPQQGEHAN